MCHECKLPIVNTGALSVSRYRGTIGAKPTLFYHKECLFKSTMHKIPDYKRGACNVCKGRITTPLNFTFESKRHKNAYHEDCVKKFIKEHEYEFDMRMRNANFAGVLANFDTELSFKKVTKLTEMDHLFTRLNTYDAVKKSLSTSRVARERYIYDGPSIGPRGVLREQYIRDNFGMILCKEAEGYIEGKSKSYKLYNNFRVRNLLAEEAVKQWTLLSVEVKNAAAVVLVERLDLDHLGRVWKELLLEAKKKFVNRQR